MVIAELFVALGVTGNGSAEKALKGVKDKLGDISSSGLQAKAAVLGVLYGLEKMMSSSAARGMELQQFANFTGLSTDQLQKWEFAARQSGVAAEDIEGSIKGLQQQMAEMQLGGGPPGGIGIIAQYTGGFDKTKMNDAFYMMEKLKQFAKNKDIDPAFANHFLKSMGLSDNTIGFLRTTKVELEKIRPSEIFSNSEIAQLSKIEVAWFNFWNKLKLVGGHLTASFGLDAIKTLQNSFNFLAETTQNIIALSKAFPVLKEVAVAAGLAIAAAFAPITAIVAGVLLALSELQKYREGKEGVVSELVKSVPSVDQIGKSVMDAPGNLLGFLQDGFASLTGQKGSDQPKAPGAVPAEESSFPMSVLKGALPAESSAIQPMASPVGPAGATTNATINQTINHTGDAKDTQSVADTHKTAARNAYWSTQAVRQVN